MNNQPPSPEENPQPYTLKGPSIYEKLNAQKQLKAHVEKLKKLWGNHPTPYNKST